MSILKCSLCLSLSEWDYFSFFNMKKFKMNKYVLLLLKEKRYTCIYMFEIYIIYMLYIHMCVYTYFKRLYLFIFRDRGREGERERNINVWLPLTCPLLETRPTTQACALTGNWTGNPLVHKPALNPLSLTSQDYTYIFNGRAGTRLVLFIWK